MTNRLEEFLTDYRLGMYHTLPKCLYSMMLMAVTAKQDTLVVNMYERPTALENCIRRFKLGGIKVKLDMADPNVSIIFERKYVINVNVEAFINSIYGTFYNMTQDKLDIKYPIKVRKKTVNEQIKERTSGNYGKNEVVLFRRNITAPRDVV